jgi:two-component system chemotaxis sensor kinase CheA
MGKGRQKVTDALRTLSEDLDAISVSDRGAWKKLAAKVQRAAKAAAAEPPEVKELLELTVQGLMQLAENPVADMLGAVDALAGALQVAEQACGGKTGSGESVAACDRLMAFFGPDVAGTAPTGAAEVQTLDDAAALLMQLDASDADGWRRLEEELRRLARDEDLSKGCRQHLRDAAERAAELAIGEVSEPEAAIGVLGDLLDQAITARERPEPDPVPEPAAEKAPDLPVSSVLADDASVDYMPQNLDLDLMSEFINESTDLIQNAEEALLSLEHDPGDVESVGKVFRAFHTVKGTSAFLELSLLAEFGHHAETLLSRVREGEIRYSGGYADLSLQGLDMIKTLVEAVKVALGGEPLLKPKGYDELLSVLKNPEAAGISEEQATIGSARIGDILVSQGKVDRGQIEQALSEHPEEKLGVALVKSQAASVADVGQALRTQNQMRGGGQVVEASVRVSTQRLDRLIDMVGELVIAHSMVAQDAVVVDGQNHGLAKKVVHTTKIVRGLQEISMSMRMVELKATFSKMARLVRDVSRKLGKNVNFITEGEDTEIDRNLVDIINDPLLHMVRNAVDHGVETPEERRAAGKPEQGTVKIAAFHSAGSVVVEISDDGKGIDRAVIIAKGKERGLISNAPDFDDRSLTDREVFNLIFEPGFSTAKVVTDVSGRGVGMDVVKRNIELLRGQVEIKAELGRGSVFKMSLPLTLAIIDGMVIRVGREIYVIPTISIIRSVKPAAGEVSSVFGQGEMLQLQGNLIPLFRMSQLYGITDAQEELSEAIVVVVEDEGRRSGLVIDELVGRQQVVIKSLGDTMRNIPGISGGAIMPDGRVGLILDVGGLLRFATPERSEGLRDEGGALKRQPMAA